MKANNTFSGGMNSDISKLFQNPSTYLKAVNFRPITDAGNSVASLTNIRGNDCQINFPIVRGVYRLAIKEHDTGNQTGTFTLTINGQTTSTLTIAESTKIGEFAADIIALINCYNNPTAISPTFAVAYNDDNIVIYQNPEYSGCNSQTSVEPNITVNILSGTPEIVFIDSNDNESISYTPNVVPSGLPLVVIGSTFINEEIFLFTCPYPNASEIGQIWKLTYDETTKESTIKLLYNNKLNFSASYPIPPSAATGRFELSNIKRIYWTDNNNYVRGCNVEDINLMVLTVDLINLRPSVGMSIPILDEILDGQAVNPIGTQTTYQCAYRLVKNNGAMTNYSPVSNLVFPIYRPTSLYLAPQHNFNNVGFYSSTTNKAIKWTVEGIDTEFDSIEFVVIQRTYPNEDDFTVFKFDTQLINGQDTISTIFRNPSNMDEITLQEFLLESTVFTHCKTLETKDNRLFFGNVRNNLNTTLDSFDSRAFRFGVGGQSSVIGHLKTESDTNPTYTTIVSNASYTSLLEDNDNIPLYNLGMHVSDDSRYDSSFKYKRNSSVIGGEGPNISYSFGSLLLEMDAQVSIPGNPSPNTATGNTLEGTDADNPTPVFPYYNNGYRKPGFGSAYSTQPSWLNGAPNQEYKQYKSRNTLALEYLSGLFRTGQHNEIYRYGIVFRSKTGETSFVKWIGDIKFPDYSDLANPTIAGKTNDGLSYCPDFRSIYLYTNSSGITIAYSVVPYIEFEVNIPSSIASIVESFEIVRVKREESDRTVSAHGFINQVATGADSEASNYFLPQSHPNVGDGQLALDPHDYNTPGFNKAGASNYLLTFHPFEYISKQSANLIEEDDRLITTEMYSSSTESVVSPGISVLAGENLYYLKKYYNHNGFFNTLTMNSYPSSSNIFNIKQAVYCPQGAETGQIFMGGSARYKNYNYTLSGNSYQLGAYSVGSQCIVVELKNNGYSSSSTGVNTTSGLKWKDIYTPATSIASQINAGNTASSVGGSKVLAIHFKPSNLEGQYGGRTYIKRTQSEYISTGAFYALDGQVGTKTIKVFGGDVFHSIVDTQRAIKNWNFVSVAASGNKHSQTWFLPQQSVCNMDMRHGDFVNKNLRKDSSVSTPTDPTASVTDDYSYNHAYSYENNIKKYYPEPAFFNITDEWNNRVYFSDVKINGETSDSWASVPTNNFYDVEGAYGGINALTVLHNRLYYLQDRAFGWLYVNPVASITSSQGFPIQLGRGDTIQKHEYIAIDAGTKHQWSVYTSPTAISFIDARTKKIYLYNGQSLDPISDTKGQKGFINKVLHDSALLYDNPILSKGILTTYDYTNNEFLYTFKNYYVINIGGEEQVPENDEYTLVYSDLTSTFSSFYDFLPYIYINNHNKLYSIKNISNNNKLYIHNIGEYCNFYDQVYDSTIKVNINSNPMSTKTFDNLSWVSESVKENYTYKDNINDYPSLLFVGDSDDIPYLKDTFTQVRCYNEYQNSDWVTLDQTPATRTLRRSEQGWNLQIPRNKVNYNSTAINTKSIFDPTILTKTLFKDRLRDKYMIVDLLYPNTLNNRFTVYNIESTYRISDR